VIVVAVGAVLMSVVMLVGVIMAMIVAGAVITVRAVDVGRIGGRSSFRQGVSVSSIRASRRKD